MHQQTIRVYCTLNQGLLNPFTPQPYHYRNIYAITGFSGCINMQDTNLNLRQFKNITRSTYRVKLSNRLNTNIFNMRYVIPLHFTLYLVEPSSFLYCIQWNLTLLSIMYTEEPDSFLYCIQDNLILLSILYTEETNSFLYCIQRKLAPFFTVYRGN